MANRITFGKTESWTSGWRGKQSETPIRVDGREIGCIRGEENAAIAGVMGYRLTPFSQAQGGGRLFYTLKEAKDHARAVLEDGESDA